MSPPQNDAEVLEAPKTIVGLNYLAPEKNSIAFGKSTSQRFYPKPHTP